MWTYQQIEITSRAAELSDAPSHIVSEDLTRQTDRIDLKPALRVYEEGGWSFERPSNTLVESSAKLLWHLRWEWGVGGIGGGDRMEAHAEHDSRRSAKHARDVFWDRKCAVKGGKGRQRREGRLERELEVCRGIEVMADVVE